MSQISRQQFGKELQAAFKREKAMATLYKEMLEDLTDFDVRKAIILIQKQEERHAKMVSEIIEIVNGA